MFGKLVEHMHWANATVIDWLRTDRKNSADLNRLMSHVLNAERVWISRANKMEGDRDTFKAHQLYGLSALNDSNFAEFKLLLQAGLKDEIEYKLFDGTPGNSSIEDMIVHAFSHGFHHMGQMAAIASGSGEKLPNVSFIGFTRQRK
jgi:uncharacterized damage-inducible protein DinB